MCVKVVSVLHMVHLLSNIYLCAFMRTVVYCVRCSKYLSKHAADPDGQTYATCVCF